MRGATKQRLNKTEPEPPRRLTKIEQEPVRAVDGSALSSGVIQFNTTPVTLVCENGHTEQLTFDLIGEEPRWRPGRSLDPSAPFPATSRYPNRLAGTAAGLGETGALSARYERSPDLARRVWDSSVRVGSSARRGELRLQPRSPSHRARPLPTSPPTRDWESRGGASGGGLSSVVLLGAPGHRLEELGRHFGYRRPAGMKAAKEQ
ncbi:hypothetical protein NDU88_005205 [Pleurodeles waltl]|uniref:Uncharacterized protein n=1 Tax=Pleurodeles waltl TaxID=8319 RepID=A0AAV7TTN2_PLEWA|nr:hypothetical protein NDU88_005205 [Pleurodeles waltl]